MGIGSFDMSGSKALIFMIVLTAVFIIVMCALFLLNELMSKNRLIKHITAGIAGLCIISVITYIVCRIEVFLLIASALLAVYTAVQIITKVKNKNAHNIQNN